ncbi:MAG: hypothetical protein E7382_00765 [Clostridiales bacterium]|nr:hypothetical protein [Clostridiales bacterium]
MGEMVENKVEQKGLPLLKLIRKNLFLIILITVLCTLLSSAYSIAFVKPTYTATSSVILRMSSDANNNQTENDTSLAQRYLPTIADIVVSPAVIKKANEKYLDKSDKISAGAITVAHGERSLIFTISYTDVSPEKAEEKVKIVIETASEHMEGGVLSVKNVTLIPTDNNIEAVEKSGAFTYVILGFAVGVVISLVVVVLKYALDNTVTEKKEFEEMTDIGVIAMIEKTDDK